MQAGRASRTAEQNALCRALETSRPAAARLFEDRFARTFLTWPLTLVSRLGDVPLFTYVHRDVLTRPEAFVGTDRLFSSLEKAGEKLTFGIEPEHLPQFLAERGLRLESDVGAADYRARYYGARAQQMRGHEFYRVARARIDGSDIERRSSSPLLHDEQE